MSKHYTLYSKYSLEYAVTRRKKIYVTPQKAHVLWLIISKSLIWTFQHYGL